MRKICAVRRRGSPRRMFFRALLLASAPACAVQAQDLSAQSENDLTADLSQAEIIVTAQRRAEKVGEVPASLTALAGEELTERGYQQVQDLIGIVPGLTMQSSNGVGDTRLSLRGVTSGGDTSQTVAIYVDDVPYGSATPFSGGSTLALELGTFDVERIEVLRGPQGTLYGASSLGGLLKYVLQPPRPHHEFRLQVEGSQTHDGDFNSALRAAVNVPIAGEALAVRATGILNRDAGFVDNLALDDENANDSLVKAGRLSVLASPADALTLRFTGILQNIDRDGIGSVPYNRATGEPVLGDLNQSRLVQEVFNQDFELYSATAEYDAGPVNLIVIGGWQQVTTDRILDLSPIFVPIFSGLGLPIDLASADLLYHTAKTTLEARAVSEANGSFEWIAGAFYTDEESRQGASVDAQLGGAPFPLGSLGSPSVYEERAVYGTANYYFSPHFDVGAGLRYGSHKVRFSTAGEGLIGNSHPEVSSEDDVVTYLFTARYRPSPRNIVYGRVASGYRPGGPNFVLNDPVTGEPIGDESFRPDTLWNYELGTKLQLTEALSLDLTAFYIDWSDIQSYVTVSGISTLTNAGAAESKGIEFAATARPAPGWTIQATGAYIDARLSEDVPERGLSEGDRVPNVPRWSGAISADYDFVLGSREAFAGVSWRYVGARPTLFDRDSPAQYILPNYSQVDFHAGVDVGPVVINLYVRNLFDSRGQLSIEGEGASLTDPIEIGVTRPRTIGLLITTEL